MLGWSSSLSSPIVLQGCCSATCTVTCAQCGPSSSFLQLCVRHCWRLTPLPLPLPLPAAAVVVAAAVVARLDVGVALGLARQLQDAPVVGRQHVVVAGHAQAQLEHGVEQGVGRYAGQALGRGPQRPRPGRPTRTAGPVPCSTAKVANMLRLMRSFSYGVTMEAAV